MGGRRGAPGVLQHLPEARRLVDVEHLLPRAALEEVLGEGAEGGCEGPSGIELVGVSESGERWRRAQGRGGDEERGARLAEAEEALRDVRGPGVGGRRGRAVTGDVGISGKAADASGRAALCGRCALRKRSGVRSEGGDASAACGERRGGWRRRRAVDRASS